MASQKPVVALDLDDLIFPFMQSVVPWTNERMNTSYAVEDYFTFNFEEVWGTTREFAIHMMEEFFQQMAPAPDPVDGATEAIAKLNQEFSLAIVTSRTDAMRDRTMDWIEEHFPATFLEVHLTNSYVLDGRATKRRKVDVCHELRAIALVDDSLANVTEVASAGVRGILFGDFAWNQTNQLPEGVTRVHNWNEVTDQLLSLL